MKILIVDDEADVCRTMGLMLTRLGHTCETTSGGEEALRKLREQSFDLVLTDLGMPGMNGLELAEQVRSMVPNIRIILITGWGLQLGPDQLQEHGIEQILDKPVSLKELVEALAAPPSAEPHDGPDSNG